jgi:DNA polymerase-3 subunit alpha
MNDFVHLRLHSEFSVTDGILRIKNIVKHAEQQQMPALALTDRHNLFGLVKFYQGCRALGLKPIIGCEVNIEGHQFKYNLLILAKNINGYRQLCAWITQSYVTNKILDVPYLNEEWLLTNPSSDIIILSGGVYGDVGQWARQENLEYALAQAQRWQHAYPTNYSALIIRIAKNA